MTALFLGVIFYFIAEFLIITGIFMGADERLETLCEKFSSLEESEKDYILKLSKGLTKSAHGKIAAGAQKEKKLPPNLIVLEKGDSE